MNLKLIPFGGKIYGATDSHRAFVHNSASNLDPERYHLNVGSLLPFSSPNAKLELPDELMDNFSAHTGYKPSELNVCAGMQIWPDAARNPDRLRSLIRGAFYLSLCERKEIARVSFCTTPNLEAVTSEPNGDVRGHLDIILLNVSGGVKRDNLPIMKQMALLLKEWSGEYLKGRYSFRIAPHGDSTLKVPAVVDIYRDIAEKIGADFVEPTPYDYI